MHKTTLFVLFMMLGSTLYSQVSFYLRPTVNMKTNQGNIWSHNWRNPPEYKTMTNEYFSITTGKMYFDKNQINLGLHFGVRLKDRHFFELGFSGDNSGIKTQAGGHRWSIDSYTSSPSPPIVRTGGSHNLIEIGSPFTRISFTYNNLVWKNTSKTIQLRSVVGFGSMFNQYVNRKKGIFVTQTHSAFQLNNIDSNIFNTEYTITSTQAWRNSFYLNLGLGVDFYTKKKNKYLFSFDIFYLQGTKNVQIGHHRIKIDDNGKDVNFLYTFSSRGSGFYFTLSRRLQIYPWRPNKK